jgi:hypothetical protein
MIGVFVPLLQLIVLGNACWKSYRQTYFYGVIAAIVRAMLLAAGVVAVWLIRMRTFPGSEVRASVGLTLVALVSVAFGPVVSFVALWMVYHRTQNVVAAEEEPANKLFGAWLPVALFDAVFVVINGVAWLLGRWVG